MGRNLERATGAKPVPACHFEVSLESWSALQQPVETPVLTRVRHVSRAKARAISLVQRRPTRDEQLAALLLQSAL
jgi:hypothetical protein